MGRDNSLHSQLIAISRDYLGPAAERFVERQITTHLQKDPSELTRQDLTELIDWIRLAFALLTKDTEIVDEYTKRLNNLVESRKDSKAKVSQ